MAITRTTYTLSAFAALGLCACASTGTYDLRPAYEAAVPEAKTAYLDCDDVNQTVCECRAGGLEQELAKPSRKHFDAGYAALAHHIEAGATRPDAEAEAVKTVLAAVTKDVEDICAFHEEAVN